MPTPPNRAYKLSIFCGAFPLIVGTLILLLYALTDWDWLVVAGIFSLFGGVVFFVIGVISLIASRRKAPHAAQASKLQVWGSTWFSALLLISNFPVAICYLGAGMLLATRYTVLIQNQSQFPIEAVRIVGGGCDVTVGTIEPNGHRKSTFWIKHDGVLEIKAMFRSQPKSQEIDSYVTHSIGGNRVVVVNPDGAMVVNPSAN